MEQFRTEEEQVEALRRWWDENGRSTLLAIVVALAAVFGWQSYGSYTAGQRAAASDLYQAMLKAGQEGGLDEERRVTIASYAARLKEEHPGSTYAQFAALQLARGAVETGDLEEAEGELRWVLGKATKGSDVAAVGELRLARVLAARGDTDAALAILDGEDSGAYAAAYATARGDVLLQAGRDAEARAAYGRAQALAAAAGQPVGGGTLGQKLDSLSAAAAPAPAAVSAGAGADEPAGDGQ